MDKKTSIKLRNLIILVMVGSLFLYLGLNYHEEYFIYQDNQIQLYQSITLEKYNESIPPWKECTTNQVPQICYWHNVPKTRDEMFIYKVNPFIGFIYRYQNIVSFLLLIVFILVNREPLLKLFSGMKK
jgi:hypothetical protein